MNRLDGLLVLMSVWIVVGAGCAFYKVSFNEYGMYWFSGAVLLIILGVIACCKERRNHGKSV